MISLTLGQIAEIVGGRLTDGAEADAVVTGSVEFDSRKVEAGSLFLALPGARVDGHEHAPSAVAAGAVAVLAARPVGVPAIVVEPLGANETTSAAVFEYDVDGSGAAVLAALATLARASVSALTRDHGLTVVGVTGSAGKTSTKDLIAAVLRPLGEVIAPPGSFNNELGHPYTALRATETTRFLVLELSARGPGNIAELAWAAPPQIGAVLNVGSAHLGEFGSRQVIAQTKGELVEALPNAAHGGVAILNIDDPNVWAMRSRTTARVVGYGTGRDAEIRATDITLDALARPSFTLHAGGSSERLNLSVHGEHQVHNALAAAAVARECGAELAAIASSLSGAAAASVRRMDVQTRPDGVTVINDSYNANPDSMRAGIKALVTMARSGSPRRSWAILGEMAELGQDSITEHDALGRFVVRMAVDRLIVIGDGRASHALHQGAVMEGSWGDESVLVPDAAAALDLINHELAPGDLVLVKASASVGLGPVAESLMAPGTPEATA